MPDPDLEIRGGGDGTWSSRRLDKGSPKNFFRSKNKGGSCGGVGGGCLPLPWICHKWHIISIEFKKIYGDQSGEFVGGYWA